jgi:hypothetical protein
VSRLIPAGELTATASHDGAGGLSRDTLEFDDEVVQLTVRLEQTVSVYGVVYQPHVYCEGGLFVGAGFPVGRGFIRIGLRF